MVISLGGMGSLHGKIGSRYSMFSICRVQSFCGVKDSLGTVFRRVLWRHLSYQKSRDTYTSDADLVLRNILYDPVYKKPKELE